jgi:UDP:flavonoid glycosyltransferase YjiC (YdhE family)
MLLIPKFADQPQNASRVAELGAGVLLTREEYANSERIQYDFLIF